MATLSSWVESRRERRKLVAVLLHPALGMIVRKNVKLCVSCLADCTAVCGSEAVAPWQSAPPLTK